MVTKHTATAISSRRACCWEAGVCLQTPLHVYAANTYIYQAGLCLLLGLCVISKRPLTPNVSLCLSQLRACLGMQIVAIGASLVNVVCTLIKMEKVDFSCWGYHYDNYTLSNEETCNQVHVSGNCFLFGQFPWFRLNRYATHCRYVQMVFYICHPTVMPDHEEYRCP